MRLVLRLECQDSNKLSINYNYSLASAIYKLLEFGSPKFSSFLHNIGYNQNGKSYKLFSFAFHLEKAKIEQGYFNLISPDASLYISSPLIEDFIKNFVIGTFHSQRIEIYADYNKTEFKILQAELVPQPEFNEKMKFSLLSPLVLSSYKEHNDKVGQHYFRYDDDINEINKVLNANLIHKYKSIFNKDYAGGGVKLIWDEDYIKKMEAGGRRISRKITITKDIENPIDIIAINAPFSLEGDTEIMKTGYECGFGEKNSMGFGLAKAV
jgi:CRISPR-associated endoribonuclease Cas6